MLLWYELYIWITYSIYMDPYIHIYIYTDIRVLPTHIFHMGKSGSNSVYTVSWLDKLLDNAAMTFCMQVNCLYKTIF